MPVVRDVRGGLVVPHAPLMRDTWYNPAIVQRQANEL